VRHVKEFNLALLKKVVVETYDLFGSTEGRDFKGGEERGGEKKGGILIIYVFGSKYRRGGVLTTYMLIGRGEVFEN
jgi:hypothetical protein